MKCPKTEHISAYLDGELEEKARDSLHSHMRGCARCTQAFEEMRSLRAAFSSTERYQAPLGFSSRVMARTAAQKRKKWLRLAPLFVEFAEAAVLVIVITVGIMMGKIMTNGSSVRDTVNISSSFSLDVFDATPPGSLGGAYLALTEAKNEK